MFVVRNDSTGEIETVRSLDGYGEGYTTLAEGVKAPKENEEWDEAQGKFLPSQRLKEEQERSRRNNPRMLLERIEALEAKVEALLAR